MPKIERIKIRLGNKGIAMLNVYNPDITPAVETFYLHNFLRGHSRREKVIIVVSE